MDLFQVGLLQSTRANILPLFQAVRDGFTTILEWLRTLIVNFVYSTGNLYPIRILFFVGIAISIILLTIKLIKYVVWGV